MADNTRMKELTTELRRQAETLEKNEAASRVRFEKLEAMQKTSELRFNKLAEAFEKFCNKHLR